MTDQGNLLTPEQHAEVARHIDEDAAYQDCPYVDRTQITAAIIDFELPLVSGSGAYAGDVEAIALELARLSWTFAGTHRTAACLTLERPHTTEEQRSDTSERIAQALESVADSLNVIAVAVGKPHGADDGSEAAPLERLVAATERLAASTEASQGGGGYVWRAQPTRF